MYLSLGIYRLAVVFWWVGVSWVAHQAGDLGSQLAIANLSTSPSSTVSVDAWLEQYNGGLSHGVVSTPTNASYPKECKFIQYNEGGGNQTFFSHLRVLC